MNRNAFGHSKRYSALCAFLNLNVNRWWWIENLKKKTNLIIIYDKNSRKKNGQNRPKICAKIGICFCQQFYPARLYLGCQMALAYVRCECMSVYTCMWLCLCTRAYDMRAVCVSVVIVCFGNQFNKNTEFSTLELVLRSWCVYTLYQIHQQT